MSIYEANSIPPHHVHSHIHSRAATSTSYLLFTCSSSWNRQQTISYILKNISYPALLPSTFPRPKTRKKSSPCRIVSTFENGAFDAPPRSIILSARQSRRDWVGGRWGRRGNRSNRENLHFGAPPKPPDFLPSYSIYRIHEILPPN